MEIIKFTTDGKLKWAIITRQNVQGYPAFRIDKFDTREKEIQYYKSVVIYTPLTSLGRKYPVPRLTITEYKNWLNDDNLKDLYL